MDKQDSNQTCLLNMFPGTSLVVQWIRLCFYCGDLRSLHRELRSHMLHSTALKKKKKKKDVCYNKKPAKELSSFLVLIVHLFI